MFIKCRDFDKFDQLNLLMSKIVSCLLVILFCSIASLAQKVKYKELVVLLQAKQYARAEPFLKRYLKETTDNPNAFLYMGITLQEKAINNDVLKNTELMVAQCDSAVTFLDKAYNTITEKELKKNGEYYQMYSRRDLRTGEFGIKLSDVRLDLETRVSLLKERKETAKEAKKQFLTCKRLYGKSVEIFAQLQSAYQSEKELLLRSDEKEVVSLVNLTSYFDSTQTAISSYKSALKQVGKTSYNPVVDLKEISDYKKDGTTTVSFLDDDLKLWDYKRWANMISEKVKTEMIPLRDNLITYDISLNKLRDKIRRDSVSVRNELSLLSDNLLFAQLKKYDEDPLPLAVFRMKQAELEYLSDKIAFQPLRDSINVKIRLNTLKVELVNLKAIDSISSGIMKRDIDTELANFNHFVTKSYGTKSVLISLINTTQNFAKRELLKKEIEWEATMEASKWVISGTDSIPLFIESNRDLPFKPLSIVEDRYTVGLAYKDSLATGYLYSITPSRIPDLKTSFAVDQPNMKRRSLPVIKCITSVIGQGQVYFVVIYSEEKVQDKLPATIAKIYKTDGLAWSNNFKLDMPPSELIFNTGSGELSIKMTNSAGENKVMVIDKNGKQL